MDDRVPVITIDGPAASGKGTLARNLSAILNWNRLDSGLLYRIVGHVAMRSGIDTDDASALSLMLSQHIILSCSHDAHVATAVYSKNRIKIKILLESRKYTFVYMNGDDITDSLRSPENADTASKVAKHKTVRSALIQHQRDFRRLPGLIADGRDMGTVIFPDADVKIFLDASVQERAQRRQAELLAAGNDTHLGQLIADMRARDERDSRRDVAPLKAAVDAERIDCTNLSIEEMTRAALRICTLKGIQTQANGISQCP